MDKEKNVSTDSKISNGASQKIRITLAAVVGIFLVFALGMAVWEKNNDKQAKTTEQEQMGEKNETIQDTSKGEEFPTVVAQPNESLEGIMKQAIFKKHPDWEDKNYTVSVTIETNENNFAIGEISYDNNKTDKYHNSAEGAWFAAKSNNIWTLVSESYVGYWGKCQDFEKFNFPKNLTPDCWDMEKNILIDTSNPERFYKNGFTKADKTSLIKAYLSYQKNESDNLEFYLNKTLYIKVNKNTKNYIEGAVLFGGIENHSNPYFLGVKLNNEWEVILVSQDIPLCSAIDPYKFPKKIVDRCYDEKSKKERENNY